MKIIDRFEIPYYQYLNEHSELAQDAPALAKDREALHKLYHYMVLTRMIDTKAIALQRTGKLGTYPSTRGQEGVFVGIGYGLHPDDLFVPYYRDLGTLLMRGVKASQVFLYWGGDERGNDFGANHFPFSVPIGSQLLHAAGAAFAIKYRHEQRAVLATCGDGATSQGDFYEALNVAGVWHLPIVFIICNNQWAISLARDAQSAAATLAQKAIAAGIPGEQVDGNDVIAVAERTRIALEHARTENRPNVIEMICYRQHDHTTADDASRYEPKNLRAQEWLKEPIGRLRTYLMAQHMLTETEDEALQAACAEEVEKTVHDYLTTSPQSPESMFDYLYAVLPDIYVPQCALLKSEGGNHHG